MRFSHDEAPYLVLLQHVPSKQSGRSDGLRPIAENLEPLPLARRDPPLLVGADAGARLWRGLRAAAEQAVEERDPPPKKLSPPALPKVPGGIRTGAEELPFGRSMATSAILRSEPLRIASRRWSRP